MSETFFRQGLIETLNEFLASRDDDELFIEFRYTYADELLDHEPFRREFTEEELRELRRFRDWMLTKGIWQQQDLVREAKCLLHTMGSNEDC